MVHVLIIISVIAALAGLTNLSNATLGVGLVGIACYLGIMARIAQAKDQE